MCVKGYDGMVDYIELLKLPEFLLLANNMRKISFHNSGRIDKFHLEGDVWSHTAMMIDYIKNVLKEEDNNLYIVSIFHDIGKVYSYSFEMKSGKVKFKNHWLYSGNIFRDFLLKHSLVNRETETPLLFSLFKVIQLHHLNRIPYNITKNLYRDVSYESFELLKNLCLVNQKGRIIERNSFEPDYVSLFNAFEEIPKESFNNHNIGINFSNQELIVEMLSESLKNIDRAIILPIAPPASGKSTIAENLKLILEDRFLRIGYDDIRLEIFCERFFKDKNKFTVRTADTEIYQKAHRYVNKQKIDIHSILMERINEKLKSGGLVFVDNTNVTFKSRRKILNNLENVYKIGLFIFNITLEELYVRNEKRNIKISKSVIEHIYNTVSFPSLTEFNEIFVI